MRAWLVHLEVIMQRLPVWGRDTPAREDVLMSRACSAVSRWLAGLVVSKQLWDAARVIVKP